MTLPTQLRRWHVAIFLGWSIAFALRYAQAVESGMGHATAIRGYVFWAVVCIPVAYLVDMVVRSVLDYRLMQPTLARMKSRR